MEILLSVLKWSAAVGAATLAVTLTKPLLDRRFSPGWRYWLWLALALALLLSPIRWESLIPVMPEPAVTVEVPRVSVPLTPPAMWNVTPSENAGAGDGTDKSFSDETPAVNAPRLSVVEGQNEVGAGVELSVILTLLWLLGAAAFLVWHILGTLLLSRRIRRWSVPADDATARIYEDVCLRLSVKRPPRLTVSRHLTSPMMTGLFRPRLCLPDEEYGERELAFIFRHELTHHLRRDLWYKALMLLVNAMHWFDPLIWLLRREAGETVELLCDEAVVKNATREDREAYCETILRGIRRERGAEAALSTHFYGGVKSVKNRFKNLLSGKSRKVGWAALIAALLAVTVCAGAVGLSQAADTDPDVPDSQGSDVPGGDPSGQEDPGDATTPEDPEDSTIPAEETPATGFAVRLTDLTSPTPALEGEGGYLEVSDLTVTGEGLSFTIYPSSDENLRLDGLRELAVYDPVRDNIWENRRENTPELREALSRRFQVYVNGQFMDGELVFGLGNGHQDYTFRFDTPLTDSELEGAEVYAAVGDPLWVADHGLVYRHNNPYNMVEHCETYFAESAHVYYCWQTGIMHGGLQELIVVWADGRQEEYLSQLPSLGEYDFSYSYYAQDISLSADGLSLYFTAPDYRVTGEGYDAVLENLGMARYRVNLVTGEMERLEALDSQELEWWEQRLNSTEWNGFVSQFYRSPSEIDLYELLYLGAGISREMTASEAALIEPVGENTYVFELGTVDEWLREHTGAGLETVVNGYWKFYVFPETGALMINHGDTSCVEVNILEGYEKDGVRWYSVYEGEDRYLGTLTVQDGKIVSFTNFVYTALAQAQEEYASLVCGELDGMTAVTDYGEKSPSRLEPDKSMWACVNVQNSGAGYYAISWDYKLFPGTYIGTEDVELPGMNITLFDVKGPYCFSESQSPCTVIKMDGNGGAGAMRSLTGAERAEFIDDQALIDYVVNGILPEETQLN